MPVIGRFPANERTRPLPFWQVAACCIRFMLKEDISVPVSIHASIRAGDAHGCKSGSHFGDSRLACQRQFANFLRKMQKCCFCNTTPYNSGMAKATKSKRRQLVWRIRVVMAERGIRTVTALSRRLHEIGVEISVSQLGRMIDGKTQSWNQEVIEGLLTVLECEIGDILACYPEVSERRSRKVAGSSIESKLD